jgi:tripartite-type tricarboxylate transporter receptor subunit TctC
MLRVPDVREALLANGTDPVGSTPEEFARHLRNEIDKWAKVVQASGLHAE